MNRKWIALLGAVVLLIAVNTAAPNGLAQQGGALPDLVPTFLSFTPQNAEANQMVTVSATIRNEGAVDAESFFVLIRADQEIIQSRRISPGLNRNTQTTVNVAWFIDPEVRELSIQVDSSSRIAELDETNNMLSIPVSFAPDLVIEDVQFVPEFPKPNQETRIVITVTNQSETAITSNIGLRVFLGKNDQYGLAFIQGGLAAGASEVIEIVKSSIPVGEHFIRVQVDHTDAFVELNEFNNTFERLIDITSLEPTGADLAIRSLTLTPSNPGPGEVATVQAVVENIGTGVASAIDVTLQVDGTETDRQSTQSLQPGASMPVTFLWAAGARESTLRVKVDPDGIIAEPNEANNADSVTIDTREPLPNGCGHYVWLNVNDEALQIMSRVVGVDEESMRSVFLPLIRDVIVQQYEGINIRFTFQLSNIPANRNRARISFTGEDRGNILGLAPIGLQNGEGFVFMGSFNEDQLRARPLSRQSIIIATVASHELGHLLGIGHTSQNEPTDIMSASAQVSTGSGSVPPEFDAQTRQRLEQAFPMNCL